MAKRGRRRKQNGLLLKFSTLLSGLSRVAKRRRRRRASSEKYNKSRSQRGSFDRFSMLPDEILVLVLSFLTFKDAAATSVLSRRWRYLWASVPRLNFDGTDTLVKTWTEIVNDESVLHEERRNFVRWVNHVIDLREGSTAIEEFRVFFNLNNTYKECIDNWLRYVLARKVQTLELNLTDDACKTTRTYDECYTFPYELLRTNKGTFSDNSQLWSMRPCDSNDFKCIRKLSMNYVNVNGEALEFFLCNCPVLEHLSVSASGELTTLKINGPSPSFKCLEISLCHNLDSVEIRDANLVRLMYQGKRIHFLLENVPLLVEMFLGGTITENSRDILPLSSLLPKLEIFKIDILQNFTRKETQRFLSTLKMSNLKQLVVQLSVLEDDSLLSLTNLIRVSPFLEKFQLEVSRGKPKFDKREVKKIVSSYAHLKEVKFVGYKGVVSDMELVMHFLENAASLVKLVIDPRKVYMCDFSWKWSYQHKFKDEVIKAEMDARARAKQHFTNKVPPSISFEIL